MKKSLLSILFVLLIAINTFAQTPMASLANSLQPGSWGLLNTNNISVLNQAGTDGNIISYGANAVWDVNTKKMVFCGSDHIESNTSQIERCVSYNDSTNTWQNLGQPPWAQAGHTDHGYYHHAIDSNSVMYRRAGYYGFTYQKFNISTSTWSALPVNNVGEYNGACCGSMAYFPELNGFVIAQGGEFSGGTVYLFNTTTQTWSKIADNIGPLSSSTFTLGAYNPSSHLFVFGQNNAFYKMDANKVVTRLSNPPVSLYDGSGYLGNMVYDPASGKFMFLTPTSRNLYAYNTSTDTWSTQSSSNKPNLSSFSVISTPVSTYGVVMYTVCNASNCSVYLYKQSNSNPPPPSSPPTIWVDNPVNNTTINGTVNVFGWAIDNTTTIETAISRVDILIDGVFKGTAFYGTSRPDVCASNAWPNRVGCPNVGFEYSLNTTTITNGTHILTANATDSDITPKVGTSQSITITVQNSQSSSDFSTRCAAAGVVKCVSFDSVADLGVIGGSAFGQPTGEFHNGQNGCNTSAGDHCPVIDTTTSASGIGSLKITVTGGQTGTDGGQWFTNFSNDYSVQFGENSEFFVQYRTKFDSNYISALSSVTMKQDIIGTGSTSSVPASSCTDLEFVTQNNNMKGSYGFYQNCGRYEPLETGPFSSPYTSSDYLRQNAMSNPPGCWHYGPNTGCFLYYANEWLTVQKHVKLGQLTLINGQWWFANSYLDVWLARDGQTSVPVIAIGPYNIGPLPNGNTQKYGLIWFLTYSGSQVFPSTSNVWYDDFIVSRNKIADPSGSNPPPPPMNNPPSVNAGQDQSFTIQVSLTGTASDDGLPSNTLTYQWSGPSGVSFTNPNSLTTMAHFPGPGVYTLTLTASDGSLTSSDNLVITVQ